MENQLKMQDHLGRRAESAPTLRSDHPSNVSSAFTNYIRAQDSRMSMGSLDEPTHNSVLPQQTRMPPQNQPPSSQLLQQEEQYQAAIPSQYITTLEAHGWKISKLRDLDWPGFSKFTGKETYPVWVQGMYFLKRFGAARLTSGGDRPEDHKVLEVSSTMNSAALRF